MSHTHDDAVQTVYATIHNTDDRLPQARWAVLGRKLVNLIGAHALEVFDHWHSAPGAHDQSVCVRFAIGERSAPLLRDDLRSLAGEYEQPFISWAKAKTILLRPEP